MEKTIESERPNVVKGAVNRKTIKVKLIKHGDSVGQGEKKPFKTKINKPFQKGKGSKPFAHKPPVKNAKSKKKRNKNTPTIYLSVSGHSIIGEYGWKKLNPNPKIDTYVGYGQIITAKDFSKCKPCYIYTPRQYVNTKTVPKHSYSMLFRAKTDMRACFAKITKMKKAETDESNPIKVEFILYKVVKNGSRKSAVKVAESVPVIVHEHEFNGQIDKFVAIVTETVKLRPAENKLIADHVDLFGLALQKCFDDKTSYMYYKNAGKIKTFTE